MSTSRKILVKFNEVMRSLFEVKRLSYKERREDT